MGEGNPLYVVGNKITEANIGVCTRKVEVAEEIHRAMWALYFFPVVRNFRTISCFLPRGIPLPEFSVLFPPRILR